MTSHRTIDRLLFAFDADSGPLGVLVDSVKKLLLVRGCALCEITHGLAGERAEWKSCKEALGAPIDYLHRNELTPELIAATGGRLPAVVAKVGDSLVLLLDPEVLAQCRGDLGQFRGRLMRNALMKDLYLPAAWAQPPDLAS